MWTVPVYNVGKYGGQMGEESMNNKVHNENNLLPTPHFSLTHTFSTARQTRKILY
jgi:hypothetical protein